MVELSSKVVVELIGVTLLDHSVGTVALAITWVNIATLIVANKTIEVDITSPVLHELTILKLVSLKVSLSKWKSHIIALGKVI